MRLLKQKNENDCIAYAVAMMTNEKVETIKKHFGHKPPYTDREALVVLSKYGLYTAILEQNIKYIKNNEVVFGMSILTSDALVIVENGHPDLHAVVWDSQNKKIVDPHFPRKKRRIKDYKIIKWYAMFLFDSKRS